MSNCNDMFLECDASLPLTFRDQRRLHLLCFQHKRNTSAVHRRRHQALPARPLCHRICIALRAWEEDYNRNKPYAFNDRFEPNVLTEKIAIIALTRNQNRYTDWNCFSANCLSDSRSNNMCEVAYVPLSCNQFRILCERVLRKALSAPIQLNS